VLILETFIYFEKTIKINLRFLKMTKKIGLYVPTELLEKIKETSSKTMVSKSNVMKFAINEYCNKILNK
jgi:predicted DNA binding CopG/RHH family protein